MGNLVDTYIITKKEEWREELDCFEIKKSKQKILDAVQSKYREMLSALLDALKDCHPFDSIIDNSWVLLIENQDDFYKIACEYEKDGVIFDHRYRGDCLLKEIRTVFYETLMVIENDYDMNKTNHYFTVSSNEVVFSKPAVREMKEMTPDQEFCHQVSKDMITSGRADAVYMSDGTVYRKKECTPTIPDSIPKS